MIFSCTETGKDTSGKAVGNGNLLIDAGGIGGGSCRMVKNGHDRKTCPVRLRPEENRAHVVRVPEDGSFNCPFSGKQVAGTDNSLGKAGEERTGNGEKLARAGRNGERSLLHGLCEKVRKFLFCLSFSVLS